MELEEIFKEVKKAIKVNPEKLDQLFEQHFNLLCMLGFAAKNLKDFENIRDHAQLILGAYATAYGMGIKK